MLKKSINYVDYNGVSRTEDCYFNLTKAELAKMQFTTTGGFSEMLDQIIKAQNVPEIYRVFEDIVMRSYGMKSPDGRRFIKSKELSEEFVQTEAYSELMMSLLQNPDEMAAFINGIIPVLPDNVTPMPDILPKPNA